jgi:exodeoxyribonuclease V alpha subunit
MEQTQGKTYTKMKVELIRLLWPSSPSEHEPGGFAIGAFRLLALESGPIPDGIDTSDFTMKGPMPNLSPKEACEATAEAVKDPKYGLQFKIVSIRTDYALTSKEDQVAFLRVCLTEKQIASLYSKYDDPLKLLEGRDIAALCKVKGIKQHTAERMIERYEANKDNAEAYVELASYDITKDAIDKLVVRYGSPDVVVDKIKENPYILTEEVRGYGWDRADAIAQSAGLPIDCPQRIKAFLSYFLRTQQEDNGNSWVWMDELQKAAFVECAPCLTHEQKRNLASDAAEAVGAYLSSEAVLPTAQKVNACIKDMIYYDPSNPDCIVTPEEASRRKVNPAGVLFVSNGANARQRVGLLSTRTCAEKIAYHLKRLMGGKPVAFDDASIDAKIAEIEAEQGFEYAPEQRKAVRACLSNPVSILTGRAGCGKSTSVNAVVRTLIGGGLSVGMCALSGRASSKLSEITHLDGHTIHRLLGYDRNRDAFVHNEANPLDLDMVVLDETSMVGADIFLALISAIPTGARFLMVGDTAQLEAIGTGNVLHDCIISGAIPTTVLTQIHRQAAKSGIITESLLMDDGKSPVPSDFVGEKTFGDLQDFQIVGVEASFCGFGDGDRKGMQSMVTQKAIIDKYRELHEGKHISANDIQVIVPMRARGPISCRVLNGILQGIVNGERTVDDQKCAYKDDGNVYEVTYRKKDLVIVTQNNYQVQKAGGGTDEIYNGNIGWIVSITHDSMTVRLTEQGDVILPRSQWANIQLAYAITVHKKQGDSVPYAIVGFDWSSYALFSRELLYTAVTRARKMCCLVCNAKAVAMAVRLSKVKIKQTWLVELLNFTREKI